MATEAQLMEALKAADAAGNVDDAKQLAQLIQAKRTAAQPAEQPSNKGPSPLRRAEAAVRGVTSGALGVGDYAAAAGDLLGGKVIRPLVGKQPLPGGVGASLDRVREERRALEKEAPVASAVGNVAGALVPISRVGSILKKGQPLANTAKTAAISALEGGVTEANLGGDAGDVATAAGVSGLGGAAVGAAARGAGGVVNFIRSGVNKNADEGFRILAKKLSQKGGDRVNPADLQAKAAEFRRVTGRAPTVMDLVGAQGAEDVLNTTFRGSEASGILADAAAKRATALQEDLASAITKGRKTPAVTKLERLRKIAGDKAIGKIQEAPVKFDTSSIKELTSDRRVFKSLPIEEQQVLLDLEESGGDLTIRQVENMRQALRSKGKGKGGASAKLRDFADGLVQGAETQVPEYGRFLRSYARRSKGIEGAKLGRQIPGTTKTNEAVDITENLTKPGLGGARVGTRAALADTARQSPEAAGKLARSLSEDAGLARKLGALDTKEAARLRELGTVEAKSAETVGKIGRGAVANLGEDEASRGAKAAIDTLLSSTGAGSLSFKVSALTRVLKYNRVPPTAAKKLAEMLSDPARADDAIAKLQAAGVDLREVEKAARAAAQVTARTAGPALTGDQ